MSELLTRDAVLKASDLKRERVEVPEWSGHVYVQTMTGTERDDYELSLMTEPGEDGKREQDLTNLRAKLCACTMVDKTGKLMFTVNDVVALGEKNAAALDRVYDAAQRLNRLRDKDVEELAKNSEKIPGENSSSD